MAIEGLLHPKNKALCLSKLFVSGSLKTAKRETTKLGTEPLIFVADIQLLTRLPPTQPESFPGIGRPYQRTIVRKRQLNFDQ
jgi:hypothetical protein